MAGRMPHDATKNNKEGDISTEQHLDRFNDFCDLEEVDYEDAKMILVSQSFYG